MALPWRRNEVDLVDVAVIGGALYLAWVWWHRGPPGFAAGFNLLDAGQGGKGGPIALAPGDLDRKINVYDVSPAGVRSGVGVQKLKHAAPAILDGFSNGWKTFPADAEAVALVERYRVARASGALALMA